MAVVLPMQSVRADFTRWVGNDGLWHIDTNWNPAVLPGANDPVLVDQGLFTATHDATSGQSTVAQVILENKMTVVLSGGTLSILGGDDPDQYFTSLGVFGQSRYMQTGGLLEAPLGIDVSGKSVVDIGGGEVTGQGLTAGINIASQSGYLQSGGTNHLSLSLGGGTALLTNGSLGDTTTSSVRVLFNGTFTQQGGVVTAHSLNVDSGGYYEMTDGTINVSTILIGKTNPAGATTSTGTLVQSAGTVSVNHTLAVMGGQYLLNAATLNASGAVHIGTDLPGVPSDALLDNNGGTIVLDDSASGVIGNGTLRHRGTLVKTGINGGQPQVATTFITSGGTIDVQNGGVALTGNLYANAPLIGTESLVKTGPGVLTLTGCRIGSLARVWHCSAAIRS